MLVVCNCHLTWEGSIPEVGTGFSARTPQTERLCAWLQAADPTAPIPSPQSLPYPFSPTLSATPLATASSPSASASTSAASKSSIAVSIAAPPAPQTLLRFIPLTSLPPPPPLTASPCSPSGSTPTTDGIIVCGDFNDRFHPRRVLRQNCGYSEVMGGLGVGIKTTWPTPSFRFEEDDMGGSDNVADWCVCVF